MSRPDKATADRHAKTLRELVKQPENKVCADCKRNDPRWASWNLGVFLCIRCSGIHRSMGTHISRVKSIDLDLWTPEQMQSIQRWGNRLANLYWEAHLKQGHVPLDHKMESYIRSKYESRRWAKDDQPPSDPSVLETGQHPQKDVAQPKPPAASPSPHEQAIPSSCNTASQSRVPPPRHLLSAKFPLALPEESSSKLEPKPPYEDLFSLDFDFHNPSSHPQVPTSPPLDDRKKHILALFSPPNTGSPIPPGDQQELTRSVWTDKAVEDDPFANMWAESSRR